MLQQPRLQEHCRALLWEGRGVLLLSDDRQQLLPSDPFQYLLPLLDGGTNVADVIARVAGRAEPEQVWAAVWLLERRGWLTEGPGSGPARPSAAAHHAAGVASGTAIALRTVGDLDSARSAEALRDGGFTLDEGAPLLVVLSDSYLRPELAELDREARLAGRMWIITRPSGPAVWIGPRFRPPHGCCWHCLEARLRRNHPHEYRLLRGAHPARSLAAEPASRWDTCAGLLARHLADPALDGAILRLDESSGSARIHRVSRRPQCPACGDPSLYSTMVRGGKAPWPPPTSPEALLDSAVGVAAELVRLEPGDGSLLPVYIARYGLDPAHDDQDPVGSGLRRAIGAGGTDAAARVSALGEAIERYSGAFQGDEPRVSASFRALGGAAIHPNECMQFSEGQYGDRRAGGTVSRPLNPDERLDWTPVRPLAGGECRLLPTALLYTGYPARGDPCCASDPSGVAASPTRDGALLHALLELIERDSLALWWYNRVRRPAVTLADLPDSHSLGIPAHHRAHGREVWALDLTSDLGVPVFAALSRRVADAGPQRIVLGFGAHLDPAIALGRALTEMDQVLCAAAADEREGGLGRPVRWWLREATVENQPYLAPAPGPALTIETLPALATGDVGGDLEVCRRILARRSLAAFWLDQTRPDIGVPVVRVVVPGLRHFLARYAPGRLYTVPVDAGWLDNPRREAELNPIEFFL